MSRPAEESGGFDLRSIHDLYDRVEKVEALLGPIDLPFKKLHPDAQLPKKAGLLEIGYDICCVADDQFFTVVDSNSSRYICDYSTREVSLYALKDLVKEEEFKEISAGDKIFVLDPGVSHLFSSGVACAIQEGYAMLLWDRSGLGAKKNIHRLAGVLDSTWRGIWQISLINLSRYTHVIKAGDKIVQGILTRVVPGEPHWVDELPESYRGANGFGSTGR